MPRVLFHLGGMARLENLTVTKDEITCDVHVWRPAPTINLFRAMYVATARRARPR